MTYLLGFSPQNMKLDGSLHTIKVSFAHKTNYKIQARHGYFAPRHVTDPVEAAKQEIQEALFSQDEIRDLPVDLHTQFSRQTAIKPNWRCSLMSISRACTFERPTDARVTI